jgi:hypothetical protein
LVLKILSDFSQKKEKKEKIEWHYAMGDVACTCTVWCAGTHAPAPNWH